MLFSPHSVLVLVHCTRSMRVTSTRRVPIAVSAVQTQRFSTETKLPKKIERGVLFSAPCLDPEIRLAAEEQERVVAAAPVVVKPAKVEKGFLFSAPCLEMNRDGELKTEQTQERVVAAAPVVVKPAKVEKGFLFSAPCLEMNRDGELKTEQK